MESTKRAGQLLDRLKDEYGEPARRTPGDAIQGLVGTILSQNTSDVNSSRAMNRLLDTFESWEAVLAADVSEVEDAIRPGGLARQKAPAIQRALGAIEAEVGSLDASFLDDLPDDEAMKFLVSIKGVGQKTAACVLMFDLEREVLPVDTHVHRVTRRIGLVPEGATANKTQKTLEDQIGPADRYAAHILFIRHGRRTCVARNPRCEECAVSELCEYAAEVLERTA